MKLQALNKTATAIFLLALGRMEDNYLKLDSDCGFMPAVFEKIGALPDYEPLYSVAHYGEQNGDLMRDPEMTFFRSGEKFFPISFRNDYMGIDQEVFKYDLNGQVFAMDNRLQKELTAFANGWFRNIKEQQNLE
jgi:hypothetical protein